MYDRRRALYDMIFRWSRDIAMISKTPKDERLLFVDMWAGAICLFEALEGHAVEMTDKWLREINATREEWDAAYDKYERIVFMCVMGRMACGKGRMGKWHR